MNDRNNQPSNDVLDQALAALRAAEGSEGPPPRVMASTIEALEVLDQTPDIVRLPERRKRMFTVLRYSGAAAALMLAVALWGLDRNAGLTFAQVIENVQKARSVRFDLHQKLGSQPEFATRMALQGDMARFEIPDLLVMTMNTKLHKGLELDLHRKVARLLVSPADMPMQALKDPIDRLRNLKQEIGGQVDRLPDEKLAGESCQVYNVKGYQKKSKDHPKPSGIVPDEFKLWVNAKTGLPVQILAQDEHTRLLYDKFQWDVPLPEDQFGLKVPPGYQLEASIAAVIEPNRIYYQQGWVALHSLQPNGEKPEVQFVPRLLNSPETYDAEKTELSPDGRYLAFGYTHVTKVRAFPPYRVLLWDRTHPELKAVEVYARPQGELQSWQFSPDGKRLFVNWWEHVAGGPPTDGREGTDMVDLETKSTTPVKLPTFKSAQGNEQPMRFGAASADGQTYLVVGEGLHSATSAGQLIRRLSPADTRIFVASVRLSPDGKRALYVSQQPDHSQQMWIVSMSEGMPRELLPAGKYTDIRARWSPDGARIAYTCRQFDAANTPFHYGKETSLHLIDVGGGNVVPLKTEQVGPNGPSLQLTAWR